MTDTIARKTVAEAGPRRPVTIGPGANIIEVEDWLTGLGIDPWSVYDLERVRDVDHRDWIVAKIGLRDELGRTTGYAERIVPFDTKPPAGVTT